MTDVLFRATEFCTRSTLFVAVVAFGVFVAVGLLAIGGAAALWGWLG